MADSAAEGDRRIAELTARVAALEERLNRYSQALVAAFADAGVAAPDCGDRPSLQVLPGGEGPAS